MYAEEFELVDLERTVFRWGGHSTSIIKYKVPSAVSLGTPTSFDISLHPEVDYKYMEVFLSYGK